MSAEVDIEAKAWPIAVASSLATQPVMIRASSALKDTEGRLSCSPADHSSFRSRSADGFRATDNETVWESYLGLLVSGKVLIIELPFCVATISTLVRAYVSLCEFCSVCSDRRPPPSRTGTGWHYTWGGKCRTSRGGGNIALALLVIDTRLQQARSQSQSKLPRHNRRIHLTFTTLSDFLKQHLEWCPKGLFSTLFVQTWRWHCLAVWLGTDVQCTDVRGQGFPPLHA